MKSMYRQGDVLLVRVENAPKDVKPVERNLIARGETSGHAHFMTGTATVVEDKSGDMFVNVEGADAKIRHLLEASGVWTQEHNDIAIPEGMYKVVIQQEYDPYAETIRKVQD